MCNYFLVATVVSLSYENRSDGTTMFSRLTAPRVVDGLTARVVQIGVIVILFKC